MLWFDGSIPAAIVSAKQANSVFVVVITGEDDQSAQMMSSWEDDRVARAAEGRFVAIKIDAKSETCVQFSQILEDPVVCIPSSFFIGENGIPLEVVAGSVPAEELIKRIDKVKQMHAQETNVSNMVLGQAEEHMDASLPPSISPDPATVLRSASVNDQPNDTLPPNTVSECAVTPAPSKESLSRPAEEGGASGQVTPAEDRSLSSDDLSLSSQPEEDVDAKVERLTKKLEERRERRKKGEQEQEIKKEIDRRRQGKEMLDYKRKQEGERTKRMLEEKNREKAARERVKQQIALDRADRAARYAKNKEEVDAAKAAALQARQAEMEAKREALQRERSTLARIQFRLPDGSSFTSQFPSEARLQDGRDFVAQEVGNRYGNFSLATMFPRREFTAEDLEKTLLELELAPSASIVLLPQTGRPTNTVVQSSGGGFWVMLGTIFYPLLAVWRFISSFIFCSPPPPGPAPVPRAPTQRRGPASASTSQPNREFIRKRVLEKRPEDFKKDGKIYRLRTQEDSEDDNNTWNGNSTQQM